MSASPRRSFLLVLVTLAACTRVLSLPEPPSGPVVLALAPDAAYAEGLLEVRAVGLAADARDNEVVFAGGAVAQGEAVDGEVLRVRVPADAASGGIAVQTPAGRSAPFGSFTFRGPGHPVRGSLQRLPLLHEVGDAALVQGAVYLLSTRIGAVVSERGERIDLADPETRTIMGSSTRPRLFTASDGRITMVDLSSPSFVVREVPIPDSFRVAAWTPARDGRDAAAVVLQSGGEPHVARLALGDATPSWSTPVPTGLEEYLSADARGGRIALLGRWREGGAGGYAWALSIVRDGPATVVPLPPRSAPSGLVVLLRDRLLVPDEDGTFLVLDLSGPEPQWLEPMRPQLGGRAPFAVWGVEVGGEPLLLLGLVGHDRLVAMAADGTVRWNVVAGVSPNVILLDEAHGHAVVTDAQRTGVEVVDYVAGRSVHRIPFDFALGDGGGTFQALAWDAPRERVLAVSQRWKALVALDAVTLGPLPALRLALQGAEGPTSPPRGVAVSSVAPHDVWVAHEWELGRIAAGEGAEELVVEGLPRRGKFVLPLDDGRVVVGMLDAVALVDPAAPPGARIVGLTSFPVPLDRIQLDGSGVLVAWSDDAGVLGFARLTLDELARSAPPATVVPADALAGRSWLFGYLQVDGGSLLLAAGPSQECAALRLDRDFHALGLEPCPVTAWGPITTTPDSRRFYWGEVTYASTVLHEARVEPGFPLANVRSHRVDGDVRSIAFDPSGARGVALVGGAEALVVLE